jgi:hypothetical protein
MNIDFRITKRGRLIKLAENLDLETEAKIEYWIQRIEATAISNAPRRLKGSIQSKVTDREKEITGTVGATDYRAMFIEYGTGQIGKRTALAQGVVAPRGYRYGPQEGHFVPFSDAPELVVWLEQHGFELVPSGLSRYDIYRGEKKIFNNTPSFKVSGIAHPFLTPALDMYMNEIIMDFQNLPSEIQGE